MLKIVAEREVSEHLKIGAVARRFTHIFDIGRADTFLARRHTAARRRLQPQKPLFHRRHTGVNQQKTGLVRRRHQRKTWQAQMLLALKKTEEFFTQFIESCPFHCLNRSFPYLPVPGRENALLAPKHGTKSASAFRGTTQNCAGVARAAHQD